MKVAPPIQPRSERPPAPKPERTARSFEAVLGDAAREGARPAALGFGELGMFGLSGALAGPPGLGRNPLPATPGQAAPEALQPPHVVDQPDAEWPASAVALPAEAPPLPSATLSPVCDAMEAETPSCIAATESGPIGSAVAEPASEPDSIAALPDRAVLRRRLDALRDGADRLSILFSEQDGAAQIVVASADRDPRAAIRLRGQVSRLLGEFGLKLADFSFNGTRPANFPRGPIGGQYGDRTR